MNPWGVDRHRLPGRRAGQRWAGAQTLGAQTLRAGPSEASVPEPWLSSPTNFSGTQCWLDLWEWLPFLGASASEWSALS